MVRRAAENRDQDILNAAIKVFSEKGYNAATTSEIAKEAGVAEGTIFRYFKNKKELLDKVIMLSAKSLGEKLITKRVGELIDKNKDKTPRELLKIILIDRIEVIENNKEALKIVLTEVQYQKDLKEKLIRTMAFLGKDVLYKLINEGIINEKFRKVNILIAVRSLVGMIIMYFFQKEFLPDLIGLSIEEQVEEIVDIFLYGISKKGDEIYEE